MPDAHLTNLGAKGLGEPPIVPTAAAIANAIRDATGADVRSLPIDRAEMLRALREARSGSGRRSGSPLELRRPESVADAVAALGNGTVALAGGTEVVPLVRDGLVARGDARRPARRRAARDRPGRRIVGAGTTLAALEAAPEVPQALREACRLAASPQLRTMGTIGGNLLQATRCWYWRLRYPCRLHGGERCFAREGEHREHAVFANELLRLRAPLRPRRGAARARRHARHRPPRPAVGELYRLPD